MGYQMHLRLLQATVLVAAVLAQTMPPFPTNYMSGLLTTTSTQPGKTFKSHMCVDATVSGQKVATNSSGPGYSVQTLSITTGSSTTVYTVLGGKCTKRVVPVSPPPPYKNNCTKPMYEGHRTISGQACDCWKNSCFSPGYNITTQFCFSGSTPVQIDASTKSPTGTIATTSTFMGFGTPAPIACFLVPASCAKDVPTVMLPPVVPMM